MRIKVMNPDSRGQAVENGLFSESSKFQKFQDPNSNTIRCTFRGSTTVIVIISRWVWIICKDVTDMKLLENH